MAVKDEVFRLAEPVVTALGYILIEVTYQKVYGNPTLTLYIDTDDPAGIGLDDCERVSRAVDPILDEADPTKGAMYHLNVSSPGLDRPLKTERDYRKHAGKSVEVHLYAPQAGRKLYEGTLLAWTEDTVTVACEGKEIQFNKKDVAVIKPVIEF